MCNSKLVLFLLHLWICSCALFTWRESRNIF